MSFDRQEMGYTTKEALLQLKQEIEESVLAREERNSNSSFFTKFRRSLVHHSCRKSIYHWIDFVLGCLATLSILVGYFGTDEYVNNIGLIPEACVLGFMVFMNAFFTCREDRLKQNESRKLLETVLEDLDDVARESPWYPCNYLNLNCPIAPSVSVQWTFRDGELVNLPCNLLVKGDLILLRPGQTVPAQCRFMEESDSEDLCKTYEQGDTFLPELDADDSASPKQHMPLQPRVYCIEETVFVSNIDNILDAGQDRPSSSLQNEIYTVKTKILYIAILPVTILLILISNLCRYFYWPQYSGIWTESVFILPVQTILPLLVIIFPPIYHVLNWFGSARLQLLHRHAVLKQRQVPGISDDSVDSIEDWHVELKCCDVVSAMKTIAFGNNETPCRTVDLVQVLGSVTAVCCLDKKGILSWPVPTIDKVFLLTSRNKNAKTDNNHHPLSAIREAGESEDELDLPIEFTRDALVEVLDVSHEPNDPYGLIFDDPNWRRHLDSLKPLGLNILLNACNMRTADSYTRFADHVTVAAHERADAIAVVNRRCLCELPRQIGFSEQAMDSFELQFDICMYKNVDDLNTRSKILQRSFTKHKTPMPNMMSVVVREQNTGTQQLMTQGSADIMLDLCSDYWNGKDLVPLLDLDRKRIIDFYHRQSMSAYCAAFAYSPIIDKLSHKLSDSYIQLPIGTYYSGLDFNSPTATVRSFDLESTVDTNKIKRSFDRRFSADSAIGRDEPVVADMDGCIRSQCNQIFIGMVTMQYQVMTDEVQMIEQLENACIRFVHFSKENELRSRVFSEKLGLESGWNCHISLLSEHGDTSSHGSSHHELGRKTSTKRTLSNSSSRHCSSHSISRDRELSPKRSSDEDESKMELLGRKTSREENEEEIPEVRIRHESRGSYSDSHPHDEGIHCSVSMNSSQSTDSMVIDSQNRAKLPKGIENIRPHLQNVDNVPLLVSLFTDCTPDATHEMIKIMQENGEVVVVVGSTANDSNLDIFLQADACIGVEPLYPPVCTKQPPVVDLIEAEYPSPMDLSNRLNSLPCSLAFHRQANVDLRSLILEARTHILLMRNCLQFYLCCSLAITLLQLITFLLLLPPILSTRHVIWLVFIILPVLSVSLVWHSKPEERLATMATGKNRNLKKSVMIEFAMYAMGRFVPSIVICILCFGLNLYYLCSNYLDSDCDLWFGNRNATGSRNWADWYGEQKFGFVTAQNFALSQIVLYLIIISIGFVHRSNQLWQRHPFDNYGWLGAVPSLFLVQVIFCVADLSFLDLYGQGQKLTGLPLASWLIAFIWLVLLPLIGELIKMREIKSSVRYQKRAKLDFGTKLGMNSPF